MVERVSNINFTFISRKQLRITPTYRIRELTILQPNYNKMELKVKKALYPNGDKQMEIEISMLATS